MAIRQVASNNISSEVPFANEYLLRGGSVGAMSVIVRASISTSGNLFIIAEDFKGTLYRNSSSLSFVVEALEYWLTAASGKHPVAYLEILQGGKVSVCIDDALLESTWIKTGDVYFQNLKKSGVTGVNTSQTNPLLDYRSSPPTTTEHTSKRTNSKPG